MYFEVNVFYNFCKSYSLAVCHSLCSLNADGDFHPTVAPAACLTEICLRSQLLTKIVTADCRKGTMTLLHPQLEADVIKV